MKKIKVIGLYSPYGDDQCGYYVVEALKKILGHKRDITLEALDRPGIKLLEVMHGSDIVFLIDAVKSNRKQGEIIKFEDQIPPAVINNLSSHQIGLIEALKIAEAVHMKPDKIIFYGIEVQEIFEDSSISEKIKSAIGDLATMIKQDIEEALQYE